jgi:RNA polymerase sigma factor (sigma-70 family)
MATAQIDTVVRHLRRAVLQQDGPGQTDGQLLASFIEHRDEAAFATLVRRHGPMVLGVCGRVVRHHQDAEDAFQATFLVLARKAASIRPRERVANWLHGVAYRTAMKAMTTTARRRGREKQLAELPEQAGPPDPGSDLQPLIDQELGGLPENYRLPILLCDLQGKRIKEAAQQLGWPQGTLAGRLARGRKLLARRLARRGVALSAASLAAVVSPQLASAVVPAVLFRSTIRAATRMVTGQATLAGLVPARVAALTEGVLTSMMLTKLSKVVVTGLALVCLCGLAIGGWQNLPAGEARCKIRTTRTVMAAPPAPARDAEAAAVEIRHRLWILGHDALVRTAVFAPDGKRFYSCGDDRTVRAWDTATGNELRHWRFPGPVRDLMLSADGKTLLAITDERPYHWHPAGDQQPRALDPAPGSLMKAARNPDGSRLVAGAVDGTIRIWDVRTGKVVREWCPGPRGKPVNGAIAWSSDGTRILTGGDAGGARGGWVEVWDAASGARLRRWDNRTGTTDAAFTPGGRRVVSSEWGGSIQVRDIDSGTTVQTIELGGWGAGVALAPDGRRAFLLPGARDSAALWDLASGRVLARLDARGKFAWNAAFSADARMAVTCGWDGCLRLWDLPQPTSSRGPARSRETSADAGAEASEARPDTPFFNGKNLFGWVGLPGYWKVHNGAIIGAAADGIKAHTFLCSERTYRDFELRFKVKRKGGIGNSGVQIRSRIDDAKRLTVTGPQIEIDSANHRYPPGSIVTEPVVHPHVKANAAAVADVWKDDGFNDMTIRCEGKRVTVTINGRQVLDTRFPSLPDEGIIAWQLHGGSRDIVAPEEVIFKDIHFTDLSRVPAVGYRSLFNGRDLTGWKTHPDSPGDWRVEDGILVGRGPRKNCLYSERGDYQDFHLRVEAKINAGGNSGLQFRKAFSAHVAGDGYEAQIDCDNHPARTGSLFVKGGTATVLVERSPAPFDTWFTQEVIARGNHIQVFVNGKKVVDYVDPDRTWRRGHLALQLWEPETVVSFRRVKIKELGRRQGETGFAPRP